MKKLTLDYERPPKRERQDYSDVIDRVLAPIALAIVILAIAIFCFTFAFEWFFKD